MLIEQKMCISTLFGGFFQTAKDHPNVQIGMTGYLDMVSPADFEGCSHPRTAIKGMDSLGRPFYSFFLTIEEKKKSDKNGPWKRTDCIYTFFQRYSGTKKVVFCTSHLKPDYSHVFNRAIKKRGNPTVVAETEEAFFQGLFRKLFAGGIFESEATEYQYSREVDLEPVETEMCFRVGLFRPGNQL